MRTLNITEVTFRHRDPHIERLPLLVALIESHSLEEHRKSVEETSEDCIVAICVRLKRPNEGSITGTWQFTSETPA